MLKSRLENLKVRYDNSELMLYNDVIGAKTIMELIGKTIGRNKAFDCVRTDKRCN